MEEEGDVDELGGTDEGVVDDVGASEEDDGISDDVG